ncbi:MAG: ABC transporter permease [Chloroflexi bacterium]|nr:ABC transporter permease [Chloroflexota bacterium]
MKFTDSFREGLRSIAVNKLRSSLTMLGVIIGVAAVIAMVAVGTGASKQVQDAILSLGSNLITITPRAMTTDTLRGAGSQSMNLTLDDMNAIRSQLGDQVLAIEAEQNAGAWQLTASGTNWNSRVTGVTTDYPIVRDWPVASGVFFGDDEIRIYQQVAVIGSVTAQKLFGDAEPVGQTLQLRQAFGGGSRASSARIISFKIVGVLEAKGATFGFNRDDQVLVPTTTAQRVLTGRTSSVNSIVIKATSADAMQQATRDVNEVLLSRHRIADPENADFTIQNQNDTLNALSSVSQTFTLLLGSIGGISLLVGGIGIMNIMLVSVSERTREIGIRKAVGGRRRDILSQFLIEAITLTGTGGVLGILLGWAITLAVKQIQQGIPIAITPGTVAVAVGVSVAIGIIFGLYPAMRASRLHPIEALRYE